MLEVRPPPGGLPLSPRQERLPAVVPSHNQQLVLWESPRRGRRGHRMLLVGSLLLILLLAGFTTLVLGEISIPSATVTITPQFTPVQQTIQIATKALQLSSSMTGTSRTQVTGKIQQSAQRAVGKLRFYNLAPFPQTIPAGTAIAGTHRVTMVTDVTATVLAGDAPKEAHIDIPAHARDIGSAGNISTNDIYLLSCCANININGVVVSNISAFSGGQDAENYAFVSQRDVDTASALLEATVLPKAQGAIRKQELPNLQPYSTPPCTAAIQANPPVGQRAEQVAITVTESCQVLAYDQNAALRAAVDQFTVSTLKQPVAGYRLLPPKPHITAILLRNPNSGMLACTVLIEGRWVFQFDQAQLAHLKLQLAGLSDLQAQTLLQKESGVLQAAIHISRGNTFPSDSNQITLRFVPAP